MIIPLTQGQACVIDDSDWPAVKDIRWRAYKGRAGQWYAVATARGGYTLRMHRILTQATSGQQVDHKDGDGLNNRRDNLRTCTASENQRNRKKIKSSSGYKGVCLNTVQKLRKPWQCHIKVNGKQIHLGMYRTAKQAAKAYDAAARRLFGEFAATNASLRGTA